MSDSSLASFLGGVARPGLVSMPGLDTVFLVLPPPFLGLLSFRRWCRSSLFAMLGIGLVLFLALRARLASLSVAVLTCYLLVGRVASLVEAFSGMLLGRLRRPGVPPRFGLRLVYRLARSPRLLF